MAYVTWSQFADQRMGETNACCLLVNYVCVRTEDGQQNVNKGRLANCVFDFHKWHLLLGRSAIPWLQFNNKQNILEVNYIEIILGTIQKINTYGDNVAS